MKLAFSTNAYKRQPLAEAVESIARVGYAGVEIMADRPHAWPADMGQGELARLREQLRSARLAVSNINAFTMFAVGDTYHPSWIEDDPRQARQRIEHTQGAIRLAADLAARTVSTEPGGPLGDVARPTALARFRQGLERCLGEAESAGVTVCVEPEPGLLIERPGEYLDFVRDLASPRLKMNLDLGHMFCVGEDPARVAEELAGHYAHVHLEDIAASRVHQHLLPGTGAMDFDAIFRALERAGYTGYVTVELYPYESSAEAAARRARRFLGRFGF